MSLHQIDKTSFRRAQCRGQLASCEVVWHTNGRAWVRDGKVAAVEKTGLFGTASYYIEGNA
jgi:hypothetical protein